MSGINLKSPISIIVLTLLVLFVSVSVYNFLTAPKVAFIDSAVLLNKYEGAAAARDSINKQSELWQANIKTLEAELTELNKQIVGMSDKWDKKTVTAKQDEFNAKQIQYAKYSRAVQDNASDLEKKLFEPIYAELNAKIREYGEDKGYDIILGTIAGGNILYGSKSADITEEFLNYLKEITK